MTRSANAVRLEPLCEPVAYLPCQVPERTCRPHMPELRLLAAVLEDAVECLWRNRYVHRGARRREFLEARRWLWDDRRAWPFAFRNVCDVLGLDSRAIRHRLRAFVATSGGEAERSRVPFEPTPGEHGDPKDPDPYPKNHVKDDERFAIVIWDEA